MDNKVINKKAEIAEIVKNFKQNLELKTREMSKRRLKILKECIKRNEKLVNDKDETDIEYVNDELNNIKSVFESFCNMCKIDYIQKTTDNSTFIETPDQIKHKKCIINLQNKDNKCFQYSITTYLYHKEIKCHPEIISKVKPFINNFNWENINFPPQEQECQQFEMNNKSIALNILQIDNQEKISHYYKSEQNKTRENKVILLMITDNEKQHYLAVKKLNALLKKD